MIEKNLRDRYSRQTMFPAIGEEGQVKLGQGKAVIIGSGALGTNIASLLVRAGVGKVSIMPREGVFAKVIHGGPVKAGDTIGTK